MMVICGGTKVEVVEFESPRERVVPQPKPRKTGGWRSFFGMKKKPNYGSGEKYRRKGWKEIIPAEITANPGPAGSAPVAVILAVEKNSRAKKTSRVGVQQEEDNTARSDAALIALSKQMRKRVSRGLQRLFSRGRHGHGHGHGHGGKARLESIAEQDEPAEDTNGSKKKHGELDGAGSSMKLPVCNISFSSIKISPKTSLEIAAESEAAKVAPKSQFPEPILVANKPPCKPDMKVESRKFKIRGTHAEVTVRCIMVKEAPGCIDLLAKHGQSATTTTTPEDIAPPQPAPIPKDDKSELIVEDIENFDNE